MPTYGIYAGYELMESEPRPGVQEQLDNEKYEFKDRHWEDYDEYGPKAGQSIAPYLSLINRIRREHPALHWLRNLRFHNAENSNVMVFSKSRGQRHDHRCGEPGSAPEPGILVSSQHAGHRSRMG